MRPWHRRKLCLMHLRILYVYCIIKPLKKFESKAFVVQVSLHPWYNTVQKLDFDKRQKNLTGDISVPFQIVSTWTRFFRLFADIILQESRGTRALTIFFWIKTISVSFTTAEVERHATFLQVIEVPARKSNQNHIGNGRGRQAKNF